MNKNEKANQRARSAIVELLVSMERPKNDDERRTLTYDWENMSWPQLLKSMEYNIENSPYRDSVLFAATREHAEWCIREMENVRTSKQRELVNA